MPIFMSARMLVLFSFNLFQLLVKKQGLNSAQMRILKLTSEYNLNNLTGSVPRCWPFNAFHVKFHKTHQINLGLFSIVKHAES